MTVDGSEHAPGPARPDPAAPAPRPGLRLRKRRATENAIETAAVDLALELGVEQVTVEAICERAGISRSTFFNYFAGRDYAIMGRAVEAPATEETARALASAAGELPRGVVRLIFTAIGHSSVNSDVARKRVRLSAEQPEARRLASITLLESSRALTPVVEDWLRAFPQHARLPSPAHEAALAVSLAHTAFSALLLEWADGNGDIEADDALIGEVFAEMRTLLAPPRTDDVRSDPRPDRRSESVPLERLREPPGTAI